MDGLVTEYDIHTVVEIPEIVLGRRQLTAVILWVVPERMEEGRTMDQLRHKMCSVDRWEQKRQRREK